jgi:hypothetical protein
LLSCNNILAALVEFRSPEGGQMLFEVGTLQEDHFYLDPEIQVLCTTCLRRSTQNHTAIFIVKETKYSGRQDGVCTHSSKLQNLTGYLRGAWACENIHCYQPYPEKERKRSPATLVSVFLY